MTIWRYAYEQSINDKLVKTTSIDFLLLFIVAMALSIAAICVMSPSIISVLGNKETIISLFRELKINELHAMQTRIMAFKTWLDESGYLNDKLNEFELVIKNTNKHEKESENKYSVKNKISSKMYIFKFIFLNIVMMLFYCTLYGFSLFSFKVFTTSKKDNECLIKLFMLADINYFTLM